MEGEAGLGFGSLCPCRDVNILVDSQPRRNGQRIATRLDLRRLENAFYCSGGWDRSEVAASTGQ